jgi:hypothetical protein
VSLKEGLNHKFDEFMWEPVLSFTIIDVYFNTTLIIMTTDNYYIT